MADEEAVALIHELIADAEKAKHDNSFDAWRHKCRSVLDRLFGPNSKQLQSLEGIEYRFFGVSRIGDTAPHHRAFENGLEKAKQVLKALEWEVERFAITPREIVDPTASIRAVQNICNRFHSVCRQLRQRHDGRPTLDVSDEYDVQDLLHALLKIHFDDVRSEEWTPSYAGASARMDFLLKAEQIVVECKKTRNGLTARKVGEELTIDIVKYKKHPNCRILVCFVYDPDGKIVNPSGLENDLSSENDGFTVKVIISPK